MAARVPEDGSGRFSDGLLHAAAVMYYVEDATQAQVADQLETSRTTVSRLLSEARRRGIVRIEVLEPTRPDAEGLAHECADELGLTSVHLTDAAAATSPQRALGAPLSAALRASALVAGDVVLVSSGRMLYAAAQSDLDVRVGVTVAPTVGGIDDPAASYQTNEITRSFAARVGGRPVFLHAPALPGPAAHATLLEDPAIGQVLALWERARCAVVGIGAPPSSHRALPAFVPEVAGQLPGAVGDVCSRFYDGDGAEVVFPGSERLLALSLERLRQVESSIAVAAGHEKVTGMLVAARAGFFDRLVTDAATATLLVRAVRRGAGLAVAPEDAA